jgi:uncharacterized SAM-binding protein YcdF (DUF218 family)
MAWRQAATGLLAVVCLQGLWMIGFEAWRDRWPELHLAFVWIVWPLAVVAWRPLIAPGRGATAALAIVLVALDWAIDAWFPPPSPPRFALPQWEALRVALLIVAAEIRLPDARPVRATRRVVQALTVAAVAMVAGVVVFVALRGVQDESGPAEAALVLGYALNDDGTPQSSLVARVDRAAALHRSGLVPILVVSGGASRAGRTEAGVMRDLLLAAGVPAGAIVVEDRARSTEENFACARPLLAARGADRVLLVTEPWHMTRAMLQGSRYGMQLRQAPASSPAWRGLRHRSVRLWSEALAYLFERTRQLSRDTAACPEASP